MKRSFLFLVVFGLGAIPLLAHSSLDHPEPKDGATLQAAPNEIRMWFTESLKVQLSSVEVRDAAGRQVDRHDLRADALKPALVHLSLVSPLGPGRYRVSWTAVAQDLHVSKGTFTFQIGPGKDSPASPAP